MNINSKIRTISRARLAFIALGLVVATGCGVGTEPTTNDKPPLNAAAAPAPAKANPTGTGEKISVKIDNATGGKVELPNGTSLDVPPGALPPGVDTITITSSPDPAPADYAAASPVYVFGPDGTVFLKPVKVSMPVTVKAGESVSDLTVFWSRISSDGFDMVPSELLPIGGSSSEFLAVGEVTHFSLGFCGTKFTTDPRPTPDPYAGN